MPSQCQNPPKTARAKAVPFYDRASEFAETVKKRLEAAKEAKQRQEMKECTFVPKTTRQSDRRGLDEFLKSQEEYQSRRQEKLSRLSESSKSRLESSLMQCPKINQKSKVLAERKSSLSNEPVHQRLFEMSRKHLVPLGKLNETAEDEGSAKKVQCRPKTCGRELALYEDAKRRQAKASLENQKVAPGKKESLPVPSKDSHVVQKFVKEFMGTLAGLGLTLSSVLSFDQMSTPPNFSW